MKRYSAQEDGAWVSEFISSRRTTRDFLPTPVSAELIEQILKDSLTAPSWSNTRPFKVAVATGEVRDRISNEFLSRWQALSTAMRGGIWSKIKLFMKRHGLPTSNRIILKPYVAELKPRAQRVGKELYGSLGVQRGDKAERDRQWGKNYEFFGAPVAMFVYIHKSLHIYAACDAGLMMENLMLSAHAHGLGTCAQGAVAFWDDAIRDEFEVSKDYRLLCGIAVGYPSEAPVNSFQAHRIGLDELLVKQKKQITEKQ